MRRALCTLALCAACTTDAPTGGIEGVSYVDVHEFPAAPAPQLDLLLIIDDTPAMAAYQDQLATLPAQVVHAFTMTNRAIHDLHIAVATMDGTLRVAPSIGGAFMTMHTDYDFARVTNFTGTFADALGRLTSVGTAGTTANQPLAALRRVAEVHPDGFLRDDAALGIVIITASDDTSPDAAAEYARLAQLLKTDPTNVIATGITLAPTPRLDEFFAAFPNRNLVVPIAGGEYEPVFTQFARYVRSVGSLSCWNDPDTDPLAPGSQYDCTFTAFIRDEPRLLWPCRFEGDELCWRMRDTSVPCSAPGKTVEPETPPWGIDVFRPAMRIECVVNR